MRSPVRCRTVVLATLVFGSCAGIASAADPVVKVAYWNVRAGKGISALPGGAAPYTDAGSCTDPALPPNAWGAGAMQAELTRVLSDPSVIALGVSEAWLCGSAENIRRALGWKSATRDQNGVAVIARHGFAGPEQWQQLDTSLNPTPSDTMWAIRAPVCLDAGCTRSMAVYAAHWYGVGTSSDTTFNRQAQQTAQFLAATSGGQPHVFGGDLNVFEGSTIVCSQTPTNTALPVLRSAGYFDAWIAANGAAEGFTGMVNRAGCGVPQGYPFKRIDYVWTPAGFPAIAMTRFGMVPAGDAAPSDHYGVLVTLPFPLSIPIVNQPPPPAPVRSNADNVVLHARSGTIAGSAWTIVPDASAAGGARVSNVDAGVPKLAAPMAAPVSYVDLTFSVQTGRAYRLWIRGRAQDDAWTNDSVFVQFSGSLGADGAPAFRIGTASATVLSIEEGGGKGLSGWGWQDNGYDAAGPLLYFDAASQRLRLQVREDGLSIDQIVLSPAQYLTTAPGAPKNDTTVLMEQPSSASTGPVAWTQLVNAMSNGPDLWKSRGCAECSDAGAVSLQAVADASFTFSVTPNAALVAGLGRDTSANVSYAIDYSFAFYETGVFEIREAGTYRREGRFAPSDTFTLTVSGGTVKYLRNDTLIYTSLIPVTAPLVADTSLRTLGAGVTGATIRK